MRAYLCPHCFVRALFSVATQARASNKVQVIMTCNHCNGAVYAISRDTFRPEISVDIYQIEYDLVYPPVREDAPAAYPPEVSDNYIEAVKSLNIGNYKSCIIMTRSALQAAMREQQATGANLHKEIEDLADRHVIPSTLRDWAHNIRDGGNLVAHPEPGKKVAKEDAEELLGLAESLFEYLYVVPSEVEARRQRLAQQGPNT